MNCKKTTNSNLDLQIVCLQFNRESVDNSIITITIINLGSPLYEHNVIMVVATAAAVAKNITLKKNLCEDTLWHQWF